MRRRGGGKAGTEGAPVASGEHQRAVGESRQVLQSGLHFAVELAERDDVVRLGEAAAQPVVDLLEAEAADLTGVVVAFLALTWTRTLYAAIMRTCLFWTNSNL